MPYLPGGVDALSDVRTLVVQGDIDPAGGAVEGLARGVVADLDDRLTGNAGDVGIGLRGDLTTDHDLTGGHQRLHGDVAGGVLGQHLIEDPV